MRPTDIERFGPVGTNGNPQLACCPFCGGRVEFRHGVNGIAFIVCGTRDDGSDGCSAIVSFRSAPTTDKAATAFNMRPNAGINARDKSDIAAELAHRDIQIDRLRKLVRYAITDYIQPEIRAEEEAFRGHEHCSNLAGLRLDLAEFQAAANGANTALSCRAGSEADDNQGADSARSA